MPEPFIQVFNSPEMGELASVVIDQADFNALCDELRGVFVVNMTKRAADAQIASLKAARTIPIIASGTKTEFVFERYDIKQDKMCVIVRGAGRSLAAGLIEAIDEDLKRQSELN
ncbi:MAG: hypothetical protein IIB83_06690 [Bacteroidetes bacterium]|nr:hypothetical protein [Bacteroidota bacterium]